MTETTSPTPAEHTALPWIVDGAGRDAIIRGGDLVIVATRHGLDAKQHEANFALIVTAVNERAGLIERVRKLEEALLLSPCPRPCNGRSDAFTTSQCIAAKECGCSHSAALKSA